MTELVQTLVFRFDDREQMKAQIDSLEPLIFAEQNPRITGLSCGDEMKRCELVRETLEREDDHWDLREALKAIMDIESPDDWSWDQWDATP